ncbi:hypothetical protein CK203_033802 [Vitis vinifera]|uniref:Uncharacterized protein n=1 Tax=Vitis vinifera TaxID=29760 RepID=A0A438IQD4_VITVI|nr:hypothetical protein CK203_033802 [Vitis vinifera]
MCRCWSIGLAGNAADFGPFCNDCSLQCCSDDKSFPNESSKQKDLVLLQNIASYMLLACGLIYVISGILCIGFSNELAKRKKFEGASN